MRNFRVLKKRPLELSSPLDEPGCWGHPCAVWQSSQKLCRSVPHNLDGCVTLIGIIDNDNITVSCHVLRSNPYWTTHFVTYGWRAGKCEGDKHSPEGGLTFISTLDMIVTDETNTRSSYETCLTAVPRPTIKKEAHKLALVNFSGNTE